MMISTAGGRPAREIEKGKQKSSSARHNNQHATLSRQQLPSEAKSTAAATFAPCRQQSSSCQSPVRTRPGVPKFIPVGERVRFSTEVAAVRIPSVEDLSAAARRQLWWQRKDYVEFRANYAKFIRSPSAEDDPDWKARQEELSPRAPPVIEVPSNLRHLVSVDKPTVEGVLVVSASPASAPVPCGDNVAVDDGYKQPRNPKMKKSCLNSRMGNKGYGDGGGVAPTYGPDPVEKWSQFERTARSSNCLEKQYNQNVSSRSVGHPAHLQVGQVYVGRRPKHDHRVPVVAVGPGAHRGVVVGGDPWHLRANLYSHGNGRWYANDGGNSGVHHGPPWHGYGGDVESFLATLHRQQHHQQQQRHHQQQQQQQQQHAWRVEGPHVIMQVPTVNSQFSMWRSQTVCNPLPMMGGRARA